ncbi:MAG: LysR family transcriptional regulator [Deltaproteobacteria bacterium]|nr:LysR family transcriptional regulator [Deltaproteobacteria bacterium]
MHIPWDDLQIFLAVAESGSLSAAAKRLRITQPTVSRRVAELEAKLGEPLFVRSVEGVSITSFAERLLEPARRMAEWAAEADRAAERRDMAPRGLVRVTAAPGVCWELLAPFAAWMKTRLPDVRLEVLAAIQNLDLSRREADLALRFSGPSQRDVLSVASVEYEVAAFAADSYVKTLPRRYGLSDVAWIGWAPSLDHLSPNPELRRLIPGWMPSFTTDDFLVQMRAAEVGLGAIFLSRLRHRFSAPTNLVELKLQLPPLRRSMHLLCAKSALAIPRVRAVADLLARELERAGR